jgi:hypothetical protein
MAKAQTVTIELDGTFSLMQEDIKWLICTFDTYAGYFTEFRESFCEVIIGFYNSLNIIRVLTGYVDRHTAVGASNPVVLSLQVPKFYSNLFFAIRARDVYRLITEVKHIQYISN